MKVTSLINSGVSRIKALHRNERGEGVMTMLMVVAVGAILMALVLANGKTAVETVKGLVNLVFVSN